MEHFGALPGTPVDECEKLAASCDVLICIVGRRYGFEPESGRGSITRREVEAAKAAQVPILAWIIEGDETEESTSELEDASDPSLLTRDPCATIEPEGHRIALRQFKAWLRSQVVADTFSTPTDLARRVAAAIAGQLLRTTGQGTGRRTAELRIVHPLQPASYFSGRDELVSELFAWVEEEASKTKVQCIVAAGGTGKTAIVERLTAMLEHGWTHSKSGSVLVWSFYEQQSSDLFFQECANLLLLEDYDFLPQSKVERVLGALRDGRPHLLILDGLERIQVDRLSAFGPKAAARGAIEHQSIKLLLQSIASGLGRSRVLITTRFRLVDLQEWTDRTVREISLADLSCEGARSLLRGWRISGSDEQLDRIADAFGRHALSLVVVGSYLWHFEQGSANAFDTIRLEWATRDDPKAAKLARVLAYYAQRLPQEEVDLLSRLAVFPGGITLPVLDSLVAAGGDASGSLNKSSAPLSHLLKSLVDRGLIYKYSATGGVDTWTAHPFIRDSFAGLLGCPPASIFGALSDRLKIGLADKPGSYPSDRAQLDRYELLIDATRASGRVGQAYSIYEQSLGGASHLCGTLGDYSRALRITESLIGVSARTSNDFESISDEGLSRLYFTFVSCAQRLGRLSDCRLALQEHDRLYLSTLSGNALVRRHLFWCDLCICEGLLPKALAFAEQAIRCSIAMVSENEWLMRTSSFVARGTVHHYLGHAARSARDFEAARTCCPAWIEALALVDWSQGSLLVDCQHGSACTSELARELAATGASEDAAPQRPEWIVLRARIDLMEGRMPESSLRALRVWCERTGDVERLLTFYEISVLSHLACDDLENASVEAEAGESLAKLSGFRIARIRLLLAQARVQLRLARPDLALKSAEEACRQSAQQECGYAWAQSEGAHLGALASLSLGDLEAAKRMYGRAVHGGAALHHPHAELRDLVNRECDADQDR